MTKSRRRRKKCGNTPMHCLLAPPTRSLRYESLEDRRLLAVVTVDTHLDIIDFHDGVTSLREAIFATNLVSGPDEIQFDFGHDGPETILLTQGELTITDSLTITGSGAGLLTIDASGNDSTPDENNGNGSRVFNIDDGNSAAFLDVELHGLVLTGGDVLDGGAIFSRENLSVLDSTISDNAARRDGGGIWAGGTTTIADSTISDNAADHGAGGGLYARFGSTTTITDSAISVNSAFDGGGIVASGTMTITGSTISDNSANRFSGGISTGGTTTIIDSTISGNSANDDGGGISATGTTTIIGSTISDNSSRGDGGGVRVSFFSVATTITDSTISDNSASTGGGISTRGPTAIITGSTISENSACLGAGIHVADGRPQITGSTISDNSASCSGGGIYFAFVDSATIADSTIAGNSTGEFGKGGGIWARNTRLTIVGSTIAGNSAGIEGGGILAGISTTLTIGDSTISGNSAGDDGGGLFAGGSTVITYSTISGNSADDDGGGIWANRFFTVTDSTISDNSAGANGGGIWSDFTNGGVMVLTQSTISGNTASFAGGGVWSSHDVWIRQSTITDNIADTGGGLFVGSGTTQVDHSILADNSANSLSPDVTDLSGMALDVHFSLIGDNAGTDLTEAPVGSPDANGNLIGGLVHGVINPLLDSLDDNGGATLTHVPLSGSPAIDAGDSALQQGYSGLPEFDQRGAPFARVDSGRIDIGAYEVQPAVGSLTGDFDNDSDSDGFDFLAWQRGFGIPSGAIPSNGDATGDGDVDGNDGAVWETTFGQVETTPMVVAVTSSESELKSSFVRIEAPQDTAVPFTADPPTAALVDAAMAWELSSVIKEQGDPPLDEPQASEEALRGIAFTAEDIAPRTPISSDEQLLGRGSSESKPSEIEWLTNELLELIFS